MKNYKNITFLEYQKKKLEMLKNLGGSDGICGKEDCKKCPLDPTNSSLNYSCYDLELFFPEEALKAVMDYIPKVEDFDWDEVTVDTKVLVSANCKVWYPAYFAKYQNGLIYTWKDGTTSFTASGKMECWGIAKLPMPPYEKKKEFFDWEDFKTNKVAVYLATQEEYQKFMKMCNERDIIWGSVERTVKNNIFNYHKNFCVSTYGNSTMLGYGDKSYYKSFNYEILNFRDFEFEERKK